MQNDLILKFCLEEERMERIEQESFIEGVNSEKKRKCRAFKN